MKGSDLVLEGRMITETHAQGIGHILSATKFSIDKHSFSDSKRAIPQLSILLFPAKSE